jgi:hypothetical protein
MDPGSAAHYFVLRSIRGTQSPMAHCELICFARKRNFACATATFQPDGQITQNLSSPSRKNIPLLFSPKSVA